MEVHELTEEEREQMLDEAFKMMRVARKHLSKQELEEEIINYLNAEI